MEIEKGIEVISSNILIVMEKLDRIETRKENLPKEQVAILEHIREQAMMRATLILLFNDNMKDYNELFIREEIKNAQKFCKITLSKLREIEHFLSK